MSEKGTYDLSAMVKQREEALGHAGDRLLFTFEGEQFEIPHPAFLTDEEQERIGAAVTNDETGVAYFGEEQWDKFQDLGGRAGHLLMLIRQSAQDFNSVDDAGNPTQSLTSSRRTRKQLR